MTARKTASRTPRKSPAAGPRGAKRPPAGAGAKRIARKAAPPLADVVTTALADLKAQHVCVLDVRELTSVADTVVIASGTSDRHVKSLAGRVLERAREAGFRALGVEGEREGEWVLVDLQDVIVHVMLPRVREFYALEKLWDARAGLQAAPG
jgi:ribosome-associated protein